MVPEMPDPIITWSHIRAWSSMWLIFARGDFGDCQ
jgi:hypothetical protein